MKKIVLIAIFLMFFSATICNAVQVRYDSYGWCGAYKMGDTYPPTIGLTFYNAGDTDTVSKYRAGTSPYYQVYVTCLQFNTSSLPDDATITSAYMEIPVRYKNDYDNRNVNIDYYTGAINSDIWVDPVGTNAGYFDITSASDGATTSVTLSNLTSISKTGNTNFRLGLTGEGTTYQQQNSIEYWTRPSTYKLPMLFITYTTGYAHEVNGVANSPEVNGVANPTEVNGI
jgi:hypothetical protein